MSGLITGKDRPERARAVVFREAPWRAVGWFGFVLTLIGIGQLILYVWPSMGFGSPEWEYGASAQLLGALPLPTVGLAALFVAAAGSASKKGLLAFAIALGLLALAVFATLALFWSVVPIALRATPANMRDPVVQTVARTTLSGLGFGLLYLWAAWLAVRGLKRNVKGPSNA